MNWSNYVLNWLRHLEHQHPQYSAIKASLTISVPLQELALPPRPLTCSWPNAGCPDSFDSLTRPTWGSSSPPLALREMRPTQLQSSIISLRILLTLSFRLALNAFKLVTDLPRWCMPNSLSARAIQGCWRACATVNRSLTLTVSRFETKSFASSEISSYEQYHSKKINWSMTVHTQYLGRNWNSPREIFK